MLRELIHQGRTLSIKDVCVAACRSFRARKDDPFCKYLRQNGTKSFRWERRSTGISWVLELDAFWRIP